MHLYIFKGAGLVTRNYEAFSPCDTSASNTNNTSASNTNNTNASNETSEIEAGHESTIYKQNKHSEMTTNKYLLHNIAPSHIELSQHVVTQLQENLTDQFKDHILEGINITADSFYSSQGRHDPNFYDDNESLLNQIKDKYPAARSVEMETYQLFHLSLPTCSKTPIFSTAASIILVNRGNEDTLDMESLDLLERQGGIAILKAITTFKLE
jgi:hypothetical protein